MQGEYNNVNDSCSGREKVIIRKGVELDNPVLVSNWCWVSLEAV